jgi:large conductance mechanosensitive channel
LLGIIIGKNSSFSTLFFSVRGSRFAYGDFINKTISFVLIAAVVYFFVVLPVGKLLDRFKPAPDEPTPTKNCTECLSSIPQAAKRCAFCTSEQPVAA